MLVGQAEHLVDDPVMGHAEAHGQPSFAHGLDRQDLLGQGDRMAGLDRHHRSADLDATGRRGRPGGRGEGVELVGDLGDPHGGQTGLLGPAGIGLEPLHLAPVAAPLGADHQADRAPHVPSCRIFLPMPDSCPNAVTSNAVTSNAVTSKDSFDLLGREPQGPVEPDVLPVQVRVADNRFHQQCELLGSAHPHGNTIPLAGSSFKCCGRRS